MTYGEKYPVGQVLTTSCVTIQNFNKNLRSSPGIYGDDTYVGYIDYGLGMSRGHVFIVLPITVHPATIGELLRETDPKHRSLWLEANLVNGQLSEGHVFEAVVPPLQYKTSPNVTITEREAILIRGSIYSACGKNYLVFVQANPSGTELYEWPLVKKNYEKFISSLKWPN